MNAAARLLELLHSSAALYEDLARNCDLEHRAVQECDLTRLNQLLREKEQLAAKLLAADNARHGMLKEIAAAMKRPADGLTLSLIAAAPQWRGLKGDLLAAGERLDRAAKTAREKSDFSRRLIGRALDTVVDTIRCATALTGGETTTYSNAKTVRGNLRHGVMVTRAL